MNNCNLNTFTSVPDKASYSQEGPKEEGRVPFGRVFSWTYISDGDYIQYGPFFASCGRLFLCFLMLLVKL
jgi:hypothetical protein